MIHFLIKTVYFWLIGFFLAILEIQIEGKHGWAEKLPTWRPKPGSKLEKLFKKLVAERELTGYHTVLMIFLLLFAHLPFIWNWSWSIYAELELLAIYMMFVVFWDFLWFVLNPAYSLRTFGRQTVWWHKKWWGKFPKDYYTTILIGLLLLLPEALNSGNWYKMIILLGGNLVLTIITILFYPRAY